MSEGSGSKNPLVVLGNYLKQMVPVFWGVSMMPYYIAWSLATKRIYPDTGGWGVFLLGLVAIGPFLGGATLLFNDYFDWETDKGNRRKVRLPLSKGVLYPAPLLRASIVLFALALISGFFVSPLFTIFIAICVILSISYSSPPLRLKERPGLDILTNMFAAGMICSLAGWVVVRPLADFPIFWGILVMIGVGGIYAPTTIIDHASDMKQGVKTLATKLGKKRASYIGIGCVVVSNSMIIGMGLTGYIIDAAFLLVGAPIAIAQVFLYSYLIRRLDFWNGYMSILVLSILLSVGNGLLLFYHAGWFVISI